MNGCCIVWFNETQFLEFACYPSKSITKYVQLRAMKNFRPIEDHLDIA
jgi:hypothetical protein